MGESQSLLFRSPGSLQFTPLLHDIPARFLVAPEQQLFLLTVGPLGVEKGLGWGLASWWEAPLLFFLPLLNTWRCFFQRDLVKALEAEYSSVVV